MDSLTRGIERACALHPGIRGVSASSIMATKIASFFSSSFSPPSRVEARGCASPESPPPLVVVRGCTETHL